MRTSTPDSPVRRSVLASVVAVLAALAVVVGYLGWVLRDYERAKAGATEQVLGLVVEDGIGDLGDIRVRWVDTTGVGHVQRFEVFDTDRYRRGTRYPLRYDPDDAGRGYPDEPDGDAHADDLGFAVAVAVVVATVLLLPWALRVRRWRRAVRRRVAVPMRAEALPGGFVLSWSTWLRLTPADGADLSGDRYQRVMWHPVVESVEPGTPVRVYGDPTHRRGAVVELPDGIRLLPIGRLRRREPGSTVLTGRPSAAQFLRWDAADGAGRDDTAVAWWSRAATHLVLGAGVGLAGGLLTEGAGWRLLPIAAVGAALALHVWIFAGAEPRR